MLSIFAAFSAIPKPVKIALAAFAATLALWAAFAIYVNGRENAAVEADRQEAAAKANETALRADRAAGARQAERDEANRTADAETRKDIDDATRENPEAARAPAGPTVNAVADSLRRRKAANDTAASVPR